MLSDYGEKYNFFLRPLKSLEKAELLRQIADHVNGSGFAQQLPSMIGPLWLCGWGGGEPRVGHIFSLGVSWELVVISELFKLLKH